MVHAFKAAKGLSSDRPSRVAIYSTLGGAVSMSLRSRMPFRSSRRRAYVRSLLRNAIDPSARCLLKSPFLLRELMLGDSDGYAAGRSVGRFCRSS